MEVLDNNKQQEEKDLTLNEPSALVPEGMEESNSENESLQECEVSSATGAEVNECAGATAKPNAPNLSSIKLSKKAIIVTVLIVFSLVVASYILTFLLPQGAYDRDPDSGAIIDGSYRETGGGNLPFWKFLLAPVMILNPTAGGAEIVYVIIALMLIIGAVFTALDASGILVYMVDSLANRFKNKKYMLIFALSFAFMFLGSAAGMIEELIPLVPIVILLCYAFGWDALVGLSVSLLSAGCGFAAGVINPFSVGVAQTLGGLPLFSGIHMRLLTFVLVYTAVSGFTFLYAKKIDKNPKKSLVYKDDIARRAEFSERLGNFEKDPQKSKALNFLGILVGVILVSSVGAIFWHELANYIMYIAAGVYIVGGVGAAMICGIRGKKLLKLLAKGSLTLLPAVVMILIVGSVRYIIEEGGIMDTILYKSIGLISGSSPFVATLYIYLIVIIFNIFIPSGSAKAFLIMPIIFQVCAVVGVHPQTAVLAYAFGDGFSSMMLPTNPMLLIILGLTTVTYPKWLKFGAPIFLTILAITVGVLFLAQAVVYA